MRRRVVEKPAEEKKAPAAPAGERVTLPHDAANEATVVAAAFLFPAARASTIARLLPDHFQQREHRDLWGIYQEAERRKLELDLALVEQLGSADLARYLEELIELRPTEPRNIAFHVQVMLWDHARVSAVRGPIPAFIEALRDPKTEPEVVKGFARSIAQCFDGYEDRKYLRDGAEVVREQMLDVEARVAGRAVFPYGLPGLDFIDPTLPESDRKRRMIPGAAPGQITVITGVSGSGKTTVTASVVLGIAFPGWAEGDFGRPGRKVLYGAWEVKGGMTLEILACISLGWSRSHLMDPGGNPTAAINTLEGRIALRDRMALLATRIRFLENPFRRRSGEKRSNARNLDIVQGYIADSGCEVFIGDLWKRCLYETDPDEEEEALIRQQAMVEELGVHGILLQQQRLKDIEMRADKRPTRDGIKGSGAWVEVPDTIIGIHRPALFKRCDDDTIEVIVLKQRFGRWPLAAEFRWNADAGTIRGGRAIEYDRPGEGNEVDRAGGLRSFMSK